jgi:hypothetical protein
MILRFYEAERSEVCERIVSKNKIDPNALRQNLPIKYHFAFHNSSILSPYD